MSTLRIGHTNRQHYIGVDDVALLPAAPTVTGGLLNTAGWVWDTGSLAWVKAQQASGGGGGGGSVTQGTVPWITSDQPLALRFDSSASPLLYLGQASPGSPEASAVWRIQLIDTTSGVAMKWAGGAATYTNAWSNRASLSYS